MRGVEWYSVDGAVFGIRGEELVNEGFGELCFLAFVARDYDMMTTAGFFFWL